MGISPDESATLKAQIRSNIESIIDIAEKWVRRIKRRQQEVRLASAFLTTLLVFFILAGIIIGFILVTSAPVEYLQLHSKFVLSLFASIATISVAVGALSYLFLYGKRQRMALDELSNLIDEMRRNIDSPQGGTSVNALALAEKIMQLLPDIVRKRNQDSFLFGIVAFILTVWTGPAIAVLIGVLVWLYFRYEMNRDYANEIFKFEEQRRLFEQRKKEFLETL